MVGDDEMEIIDALKTAEIKVVGAETKLDDIGEFVKQLGVRGVNRHDERHSKI